MSWVRILPLKNVMIFLSDYLVFNLLWVVLASWNFSGPDKIPAVYSRLTLCINAKVVLWLRSTTIILSCILLVGLMTEAAVHVGPKDKFSLLYGKIYFDLWASARWVKVFQLKYDVMMNLQLPRHYQFLFLLLFRVCFSPSVITYLF